MAVKKEDIEELHVRKYSIYDNVSEQENALTELYDRAYRILDDYECGILRMEYEEECDRISPNISSSIDFFQHSKEIDVFECPKEFAPELTKLPQRVCTYGKELFLSTIHGNTINILFGLLDKLRDREDFLENVEQEKHLFYIKRLGNSVKKCNAVGYYDVKSKEFILLKESYFDKRVTPIYMFSTAGIKRSVFVSENCIDEVDLYILKRDCACSSPSAAASFVLGRSANGWNEWKDSNGCTLNDFYPYR